MATKEDYDKISKYPWSQLAKTEAIQVSDNLIYTITRLNIVEQKWPAEVTPKSWVVTEAVKEIDRRKARLDIEIQTMNGIPVEEIKKSYPIWTYDGLVDAMRSFRAKYSRSKV